VEIFAICSELAEGRILPAGWTSGYDNQNRQYFVDEVLQLLAPMCSLSPCDGPSNPGVCRSSGRVHGSTHCCRTIVGLCTWSGAARQLWLKLNPPSHAQMQRCDLVNLPALAAAAALLTNSVCTTWHNLARSSTVGILQCLW